MNVRCQRCGSVYELRRGEIGGLTCPDCTGQLVPMSRGIFDQSGEELAFSLVVLLLVIIGMVIFAL